MIPTASGGLFFKVQSYYIGLKSRCPLQTCYRSVNIPGNCRQKLPIALGLNYSDPSGARFFSSFEAIKKFNREINSAPINTYRYPAAPLEYHT